MGKVIGKIIGNCIVLAFPIGMLLCLYDFWFGVKVMWCDIAIALTLLAINFTMTRKDSIEDTDDDW